jgi:hypothetical protein
MSQYSFFMLLMSMGGGEADVILLDGQNFILFDDGMLSLFNSQTKATKNDINLIVDDLDYGHLQAFKMMYNY